MRNQIAFSVSAGAYVYQMGIGCYLQRHFDLSNYYFSGASGGAWVALLLASGQDIKAAFDIMLEIAHRFFDGRLLGSYLIYDQAISESFHRIYEGVDLPSIVNGRLSIVLTRLHWSGSELFKQEVIDHWTSNDDVLQCVIASALIPFALNGRAFVKYRGWYCLDGGVTNIEGINQAWALAHRKTASLIQASGEGCFKSIEDLVNDEECIRGIAITEDQALVVCDNDVCNAIRWIPFAGYVTAFLAAHVPNTTSEPPISDAIEQMSAKPPTHLIRFVGKVAKLIIQSTVDHITYPVRATAQTAMELQRQTWQLTSQLYQRTEGAVIQLHESLPLKQVRDNMLSYVLPSTTSTQCAATHESESITDEPSDAFHLTAATQLLHERIRQAIESSLTPWQLGRMASAALSNKLEGIAQNMTNSIFDLLATPSFSLEDKYEDKVDRNLHEMCHTFDIEAQQTMPDTNDMKPSMPMPDDIEPEQTTAASTTKARASFRRRLSDTVATVFYSGRSSSDITPHVVAADGHSFDHTAFWGEKHREFVVKALPNGGKRLELAPWSWRKHDILTYHLSADLNVNRKLFALGILDAESHHWELHEFFE